MHAPPWSTPSAATSFPRSASAFPTWDYHLWLLQHALRTARLKGPKRARDADSQIVDGGPEEESEDLGESISDDLEEEDDDDDDDSSVHTPSPTSTLHTYTQAHAHAHALALALARSSTPDNEDPTHVAPATADTATTTTTSSNGTNTRRQTRALARCLRALEAERRLDADRVRALEEDRAAAARRRAWLNGSRVPSHPRNSTIYPSADVDAGSTAAVLHSSPLAARVVSWSAHHNDNDHELQQQQRWPACDDHNNSGSSTDEDDPLCAAELRFDAMLRPFGDPHEERGRDADDNADGGGALKAARATRLGARPRLGLGLGLPSRVEKKSAPVHLPCDVVEPQQQQQQQPATTTDCPASVAVPTRAGPRVRTCSMSLPHDVCLALEREEEGLLAVRTGCVGSGGGSGGGARAWRPLATQERRRTDGAGLSSLPMMLPVSVSVLELGMELELELELDHPVLPVHGRGCSTPAELDLGAATTTTAVAVADANAKEMVQGQGQGRLLVAADEL